jgi:hemerythrin-like domain-containing protein
MKRDITKALVEEHKLILRMLAALERNAQLTARCEYGNYRFYLEAVDFIRNYADRFHHAKEEDVLFEALVANGMPRDNSPVAAMLVEHDHGRAFVRAMEQAANDALAGKPGQDAAIAENALGYIELLRGHIGKEDGILYPLAERLIPDGMRDGIVAGYENAEKRTPAGFSDRYERLVARCEAEFSKRAA